MNALEQAEETTSAALTVIRSEIDALDGWTIDDEDDNEFAAEMLRNVKSRHKYLEDKRKGITGPMNKAMRAVNDLFRPPRTALENAERILKSKIAGYLEACEAANTAALVAASTAETVEEASAALATVEHADAPKGVSVRYKWRAIVVNEELLDRRFLVPDIAIIEEWGEKYGRVIPGVEFERVPIVSSRAVQP